MQEVELGSGGLRTTQLGFGCGRLFRITNSAQRQRILETALDLGIRHFDVARMYGLGLAEGELGRFAQGKRDRLTLATKFGIEPRETAARLAPLQSIARGTLRWFPALRLLIRPKTEGLYRHKEFSMAVAERSLEKSLGELKTDYIDLFLLHEPSPKDGISDDLLAWLENARRAGKILHFGIAGEFDDMCAIVDSRPALAPVIQFPNDVLMRNLERFNNRAFRGVISFAPFSRALDLLMAQVRRGATRHEWSNRIGLDVGDSKVLANLLLKYSMMRNPGGVTLFSTTRTERLADLVTRVRRNEISNAQVEEFVRLATVARAA